MDNRQAKSIVAAGYDRITASYLRLVESGGMAVRDKYLALICERVPAGSRVVELGCGAGVPMTRALAGRYDVVALDISAGQLTHARANAPAARLLRADIACVPLADACADAVAAFYSTTHVPRDEHPAMLAGMMRIVRPGGIAVTTWGFTDNPSDYDDNWLGAPMFFSHFDAATSDALVRAAGFTVLSSQDEQEQEYDRPMSWRWIVAQRPA